VTSLADLLFEPAADKAPDASPNVVLVHAGEQRVTRAQLTADALAVRDALIDAGIGPGSPVAVMLGNGPGTVAALFGVWAAGAVYVPVNPRLTDSEIARLLDAVPPAALVATADDIVRFPDFAFGVLRAIDARLGIPRVAGTRGPFDDDVALVQTTSGTTGPPTPVPLRHSQVLALLDGVLGTVRTDARRETPPMPNLIPVSLSLWAGIYNVCFAFRVGAPVVLMERFEPRELARLVAEHGIRSVVLPPAAMAACCDDAKLESLAPLRYVRSITAPLSPFLARRFHDRFGVAVLNGYGQTELGGEVVGWSAADWREFGETKLGAVGRPHTGVELRVDDTGELWVRTAATRDAPPSLGDRSTPDGWLRTGDHGRVDDEGFLWIEGRASDMVNRGGLKVFPAEVEEVLRSVPGVRDVAVVGIPDERLGEVPVAAVVGNADPGELDSRCRAHLAPYKVPARFVIVDALPRNEVGKVLSAEVQQRWFSGD
jgi:acyl-CoA synthetase (AMP-forming)/AMP-acid ligase II